MLACQRQPVLLISSVLVAAVAAAEGSRVSQQPPAEYTARIAPRLSRLPPPAQGSAAVMEAGGLVLLDEEVAWVSSDGSSIRAIHRVLAPASERGVDRAARIIHPFVPRTETVHVVRADRVAPDGTRTKVSAEAVFQETPQPLADRDIHVDVAQAVILLPGVRPGDRVDVVIVVETAATIPGEFTAFLPAADPWPIRCLRREVLLSEEMASRLVAEPLGLDRLERSESKTEDDRVAVAWSSTSVPAQRLERGRAPIRQVGPGIWLSTVSSWDGIAAWYDDLTADARNIDAGLRAAITGWTDGADDANLVVKELHRRISDGVRYVSVALGMSSLRPRAANEVWQSRWGDCKDQANLLRVMLREAGIDAHLVLVNRDHAGRVVPSVPDFRQFNHVIVGVPRPEGGWMFCDPTAMPSSSGSLPPSLADRLALVVLGDRGELVRLPPARPQLLGLSFDLELTDEREIYGWVRMTSDGSQGEALLSSLAGGSLDRPRRFLEQLFPAVQVIDVGDLVTTAESSHLDLYLHALAVPDERGVQLRLPCGAILLPDVGESEQRQTPYWRPAGRVAVDATFTLPSGWTNLSPPPPRLELDTGILEVQGAWHRHDAGWHVTLDHEVETSLISQVAFVPFVRASQRLEGWIGQPLVVGPATAEGSSTGAAPPPPPLPRLTDGQAQLRLVNARFPADGGAASRRHALRQVQSWFEDDPATYLEAGLEVALLDQEAGMGGTSVRDIRALLARCGDAVDPTLRGWAEYLLADGLRTTGDVDEAFEIYERLAHDPAQPVARRGWAYARAASLLQARAPLEAMGLLNEALLFDSPALTQQVALLVDLLLDGAPQELIEERLALVSEHHPHRCVDIHTRLSDEVYDVLNEGEVDRAARLVEVLDGRVANCPELGLLDESLLRMKRLIRDTETCRSLAADIGRHLTAEPPSWWCDARLPSDLTRDRLIHQLQMWDMTGEHRLFVRGAVELVTRWNVNPDFFSFLIAQCVVHLEKSEVDPRLLERFLAWREALPNPERFRRSRGEATKVPEQENVS